MTIGHDNHWYVWRTADATKLLELPVPEQLSGKALTFRPRFVRFTQLGRCRN